jgi:hypothetical protein
MNDNQTTNEAIEAFYKLSDKDTAKLKDLNKRVQNHQGKWSKRMGGEEVAENTIEMPWIQNDELIMDFVTFVYDRGLTIVFNWKDWDEGGRLYKSEDQTKYDNVDLETVLKLITSLIRQDRFADGSLAWAFESGNFPKLINRLVELKERIPDKVK